MDGEFFTVCLRELIRTHPQQDTLLHFFHALECDAEEVQLDDTQLFLSVSYLQCLYMQSTFANRAAILRILLSLEIFARESIFERYNIDSLAAISLRNPLPDPVPKLDEERIAVFRHVLLQLKGRQTLSDTIGRALVNAYSLPNNNYSPLIFAYLCEAITVNPDISCKTEIINIIVDKLVETGDVNLVNLICYCLEHIYSPFIPKHTLSRIISPIISVEEVKPETLASSIKALTYILQSWPGLLGFVIPSKTFEDIAICIEHDTKSISTILANTLEAWHKKPTVLTGYIGFLLYQLRSSGLYDILKQKLPTNDPAIRLLEPYESFDAPYTENKEIRVSSSNSAEILRATMKPVQNNRILINCPELPPDNTSWDWNYIYNYLTIVLPNNPKEAYGGPQTVFYKDLLNYFSGPFMTIEPTRTHDVADSLVALVKLLLSNETGLKMLENCINFKNALTLSVHSLRKHDSPRNDSPAWSHFRTVCMMMTISQGIGILQKWDIQPALITLSSAITNIPSATFAMSMLQLYPEFDFASPVYMKFMLSPKVEISHIAIQSLREKRFVKNYFETAFVNLIIPYLKQLVSSFKQDQINQRISPILQLLYEVVQDDPKAAEYCANDKEVHAILCKYGPIGYSYIFSTPSALNNCVIKDVVDWWMNEGNVVYVNAFDKAAEQSFLKKPKSAIDGYPGLTPIDEKSIVLPPHLFGMMNKYEKGVEILAEKIPDLINTLENGSTIDDVRGAMFALAHFGSSLLSLENVKKHNIPGKLLEAATKSSSLVVRGTLINCFTIIDESEYFYDFLSENGWELTKFGGHSTAVPIDVDKFVSREDENDVGLSKGMDLPKGFEPICNAVLGLMSPLQANQSKTEINKYKDQVKNPIFAAFVHHAIGRYTYADDVRKSLEGLVENVPLLPIYDKNFSERMCSEARARIAAIAKRGMNEAEGIRRFDIIPTDCTAKDMCIVYGGIACVEWFVDDEKFKYFTGCESRDEFYNMPYDRIENLRRRILENF